MAIHGNTWLYMAVHVNTWLYIMFNTWQYMVPIHGNTWQYMVKHSNCFAFRPQPALPRKLDSVNLVPRGYFRLYKRPRGIRQRKD